VDELERLRALAAAVAAFREAVELYGPAITAAFDDGRLTDDHRWDRARVGAGRQRPQSGNVCRPGPAPRPGL